MALQHSQQDMLFFILCNPNLIHKPAMYRTKMQSGRSTMI
jgi:hypothetical protein